MSGRLPHAGLAAPALLTAALLAARLVPVPALTDPVSGGAPEGLRLAAPALYVALAPLFSLWDGVSMLSQSRLRGFLQGVVALYALWRVVRALRRGGTSWRREALAAAAAVLLLAAFVAGGALWHRPMLALEGAGRDDVVADFHSHTSASHDVRGTAMRGFDAEASRRWHRRAGFDAFFVTDHNTLAGLPKSPDAAGARPRICPGVEVSAWRAHVVLPGVTGPVERGPYARSLDGLLALLRTSDSAFGAPSIASLPEYERHHRDRLELLVGAGLDGFEVVNAAPKANELSRARRDSVIALARRRDLVVVGVSDSHGWGATSMVWNLVRLPGWRTAGAPCERLVARLREGFGAVRVVERHRLRADAAWPGWLTPVGVAWETWRAMGWALTASWLAWVWGLWLAGRRGRGGYPTRQGSIAAGATSRPGTNTAR